VAIQQEIEAIMDDGEALKWSTGAVWGTLVTGAKSRVNPSTLSRLVLASMIVAVAVFRMKDALQVIQVRVGWALPPRILDAPDVVLPAPGSAAPTGDALASLIQTYPLWSMAMLLVWSLLIGASGVQLLRRKRSSVSFLVGAILVFVTHAALRVTDPYFAALDFSSAMYTNIAILTVLSSIGLAMVLFTRGSAMPDSSGSEGFS
jgi:hypothetical protein